MLTSLIVAAMLSQCPGGVCSLQSAAIQPRTYYAAVPAAPVYQPTVAGTVTWQPVAPRVVAAPVGRINVRRFRPLAWPAALVRGALGRCSR